MNMLTGSPSRNATTVGIPGSAPPGAARCHTAFASTSSFASRNAPSRSSATFSRIGPSVRHGRAPGGPQVDDDGTLLRALDHDLLEVGVGDLDDVGGGRRGSFGRSAHAAEGSHAVAGTLTRGVRPPDTEPSKPQRVQRPRVTLDSGHRGRRPHRVQHAEDRERDHHHVVRERPEQVLRDDPVGPAGQLERVGHRRQRAAQEVDVGRRERDVGARAHRDADVGRARAPARR